MDIPGAQVGTGSTYYGSMSYNAQMTYDFGTDRLYLHATYHTKQLAMSSGMYMFMLGEGTPELDDLGKISVQTAPGRTTKQGDAYLGLLCSIPTAEQTPVGKVNGILLNKTVGRLALGESFQLTGKVRRPTRRTRPSPGAPPMRTLRRSMQAVWSRPLPQATSSSPPRALRPALLPPAR